MAIPIPTEEDVLGWMTTLSNWGRWGPEDELGTLNLITPEKRVQAGRLGFHWAGLSWVDHHPSR